jgi:hypothetical protein
MSSTSWLVRCLYFDQLLPPSTIYHMLLSSYYITCASATNKAYWNRSINIIGLEAEKDLIDEAFSTPLSSIMEA